ncbi:MAG: RraA family protein [Chloroflexi bacterium]|nr:RraA family protein [Chloroflexota bacterium]
MRRLANLDTCALSDALDRLGLPGAVVGIRPMWACPRIAGRVVTVKLKPKGEEVPKHHLGAAAVVSSGPGDVIVVDHGGRAEAAGWGGILSVGARTRGVEGVIIDGACRDVDESREVGFPVYARSAVPITARGRIVEESTGEPISIGGHPVNPGDLVLADGSGVVFIPAVRAEEVLAVAESIAAREAEMAAAVRAGRSILEVMGAEYERMLSR